MYNKKVLIDALKNLGSAKAPAKKKDIITDPEGQWKFPGQPTRIPSNEITMKGVPYPVLGKGSDGSEQMMYPGGEYTFPGADYVDEYPMMESGGQLPKAQLGLGNLGKYIPKFFKGISLPNPFARPKPNILNTIPSEGTIGVIPSDNILVEPSSLVSTDHTDFENLMREAAIAAEEQNKIDLASGNYKPSSTYDETEPKVYFDPVQNKMVTKENFENQFKATSNLSPLAKSKGDIPLSQVKGLLGKESMGLTHKWPILEKQLIKEFGDMPTSLPFSEIQRVTNNAIVPYTMSLNPKGNYNYGVWDNNGLGFKKAKTKDNWTDNERNQYTAAKSYLDQFGLLKAAMESGDISVPTYWNEVDKSLSRIGKRPGSLFSGIYKIEDLESIINKWDNPEIYEPLSQQTNVLSGLGEGSIVHNNPEGTLAAAHSYIDPDTPDTRTYTQLQSDALQGTHHIWKNKEKNLEKMQKDLQSLQKDVDLLNQAPEGEKRLLEESLNKSVFEKYGLNSYQEAIDISHREIANAENELIAAKGPNPKQKELLEKNWESVLLQQLMSEAAAEGMTKIRVPTGETSIKIQNYRKVPQWTEEETSIVYNLFNPDIFETTLGETPKPVFKDYTPKQKTVIKRYNKIPKTLKRTFGFTDEQIEIKTDRNGNTWYEVEIPESFLQGQGQIIHKDGGPVVKQRRGTRKNPDGSESTHLMMAEYIPERGWVAFPSLFQDSKPYADDQQNWVDMSNEEDWMKIYEEAERRGEVYDFGEDKEAALAFGEGSWKDQLPDKGMEVELDEKEIQKYIDGGYIVEELPKAQLGKGVSQFLQTIGKLKLPWTSAVTPTINNLNNQLGVINDNSKFINDGLLDSHLINPSSTVLSPMRTAESVSHKIAAKKRDLDLSAFSPGNYKRHADNFISAALYPFMGPAVYKSAELYNMIMPPGYRTQERNTIIGHMTERLGNQYYDQMLDPNEPLNLWDNNTTYYLGKKYGVDWNQAMDGWIERHNQSVIDRNQSRRKFLKDDLQKEWARENNLQWWYDNGKLQTSDSEDYMVFPPTEKSLEWDKIVDEKYPLIDQYPTITKSGIYTDAISRPLTMFLKDETTPGNHLYRKIGNKSGLKDLIDKGGAQAPRPFKMRSGITIDTPFFGKGSNPSRDYKGMFAVELDPKAKGKYNWSSYVGGTSNYGVAPFDQKGLVKNIPLDDLNVYRRKWFSNKYKKLDKEKLEKELKNADAQWWAENLWKWGYRGAAADYYLNEGKITRNLLGLDEKAVGGEVISLGDEVDEATMKKLKAQGYTFEEI